MTNEYLSTAIQAAKSSGKILTEYFEKLHDFRKKNQNIRDLVTQVDLLSEKNIMKIIVENHPNHNVIGEETGELGKHSKYCWHVDPIDGTVNYSQGIPLCAISVGLEHNNKIIVGAIYNPFTEELFFASKGHGAFLNGKPIRVSSKTKVEDGLYVAAFSSEIGKSKKDEYEAFGNINDSTRGVLRIGSAALALAYLACGRIDGFWAKGLFPWDLAAGIILVEEAGGKITDEVGQQFQFSERIVTSNNILHHSLLHDIENL